MLLNAAPIVHPYGDILWMHNFPVSFLDRITVALESHKKIHLPVHLGWYNYYLRRTDCRFYDLFCMYRIS